MKKIEVVKDMKRVKELMEFSRYRENRTEILIWGILVTIGYVITHFLQFSFPIGIPFVWLVVSTIGIASSISFERADRSKFGESFSFIGGRLKYIWFCVVSVGFLITYFSIGLAIFPEKFIPVFWFLVIGIGLFVQGLFLSTKWSVVGLLHILSGGLLVFIPGILDYWALLFAIVHGGSFIIIGLTKNDKNR